MSTTFNITDEVRDIIARSTMTATIITLPPHQLPRLLYEAVNKVLAAAGGKWNRQAKAHMFIRDPREALALALETGTAIKHQQVLQQFYTPAWLAEKMVEEAGLLPTSAVEFKADSLILEPSAGMGALALAAMRIGQVKPGDIRCYEIDPVCCEALRLEGFHVWCRDFLTVPPVPCHDIILMNPPFAKGQDVTHVMHALHFLRPGGRLVAVMSAGVAFRKGKAFNVFRNLIASWGGRIEALPATTFKAAGTHANAVFVCVDKPQEKA